MPSTPARSMRRRSLLAGEASAAAAEVEAALSVPPDPTAGAFFDVDNTIVRGASIFYLAKGLYARKFFGRREIIRMARQQFEFLLGGENMEHVHQTRSAALGFIQGHSVDELTGIAEDIFDELIADKIWPGTKALAQMHLDAGQRVWLVTAAPVEIAGVIARRLGLTGALGTVAEHVDEVYTGRLVGELLHGQAKADAVHALAQREGLNLSRCSAYSDSSNDIPMLSTVGHPCAINPDRALRSHARAQGWRVRDYRRQERSKQLAVAAGAGAVVGGLATGLTVRHLRVGRRRR